MKLGAKELRELNESEVQAKLKSIKRRPLYFILENIYDTYNVGGLFRLADALSIEKLYLCGETETPPNSRIKKASIGTYKVVPWEYKKTVVEAIKDLRFKNKDLRENSKIINHKSKIKSAIQVVAVEQHPKATLYSAGVYRFPLALVFGNETTGILPETLKLADTIVEIPMWGINKSLNVIVSAAIVSYWIITSAE